MSSSSHDFRNWIYLDMAGSQSDKVYPNLFLKVWDFDIKNLHFLHFEITYSPSILYK